MSGDRLRELCAELVEALDAELDLFETRHSDLIDRARALLAEAQPVSTPEPVGPTDAELLRTFIDGKQQNMRDQAEKTGWHVSNVPLEVEQCDIAGLRAVLAEWGRPAPAPPAPSTLAGQGELVRSVVEAIQAAPAAPVIDDWTPEARAAILAVADWLADKGAIIGPDLLRREVGR